MKMLVFLVMEHNHNPLIYGFLLSILMFVIGVGLVFFSRSGADFQSQLVLYGIALMMIIASTVMVRGVFQTRDNCPICHDKYRWYRKKNE